MRLCSPKEECIKETIDQIQIDQENFTSDFETNDGQISESQKSDEMEKALKIKREGKLRSLSGRVVSSQGKNVKINIPLTTPTRTLSVITYLLREDLANQSKKSSSEGSKLSVNKTKLHHAQKMIRGAFNELYKGLGYLNTYRNLNMLAFVKILNFFDKVTAKQVLPIYLKVVESSYFNSSDKVVKLGDEVEEMFVKHFAEDNKTKAMKYLKPRQHKESHGVTFFIGGPLFLSPKQTFSSWNLYIFASTA